MNNTKMAAAIAKPMPMPSGFAFPLSSNWASSSSSLAIELVRSATSLTASPTLLWLVARVAVAPPFDEPREDDPSCERDTDDDPRVRALALTLLLRRRTALELRSGRRDRRLCRLLVRRRLSLHARLDHARLHPPDQVGVLGQGIGQLRLHASLACHSVGELLDLVRHLVDLLIRCAHLSLDGGSSPVNKRQMPEAVRRPISAASAVSPARRPAQSIFRSMTAFCTSWDLGKPAYVCCPDAA